MTALACPIARASVPGTDVTYTLDADFDQGVLLSVVHDPPNPDQLQLSKPASPLPFVNIAASARGTVERVDANTGQVLGEYLTAPDAAATEDCSTAPACSGRRAVVGGCSATTPPA